VLDVTVKALPAEVQVEKPVKVKNPFG